MNSFVPLARLVTLSQRSRKTRLVNLVRAREIGISHVLPRHVSCFAKQAIAHVPDRAFYTIDFSGKRNAPKHQPIVNFSVNVPFAKPVFLTDGSDYVQILA
jgi:hypothetical protein